VTYEYYWGRLMVDWPGAPNHLRSHTAATKYKVRWLNDRGVRREAMGQGTVGAGGVDHMKCTCNEEIVLMMAVLCVLSV
jgi:hypothetical protein